MKVLKAFTTPSRRFAPGQKVTPADLDGPLTIEDLQDMDYVEAPKAYITTDSDPKKSKVAFATENPIK